MLNQLLLYKYDSPGFHEISTQFVLINLFHQLTIDHHFHQQFLAIHHRASGFSGFFPAVSLRSPMVSGQGGGREDEDGQLARHVVLDAGRHGWAHEPLVAGEWLMVHEWSMVKSWSRTS